MAIRIHESSVDGVTGHIQVKFCVEEKSENGEVSRGAMETAHLESHSLFITYHGPEKATKESINKAIMKWLRERHNDALTRKRHIDMTSHLAGQLKGKVVEFE